MRTGKGWRSKVELLLDIMPPVDRYHLRDKLMRLATEMKSQGREAEVRYLMLVCLAPLQRKDCVGGARTNDSRRGDV